MSKFTVRIEADAKISCVVIQTVNVSKQKQLAIETVTYQDPWKTMLPFALVAIRPRSY